MEQVLVRGAALALEPDAVLVRGAEQEPDAVLVLAVVPVPVQAVVTVQCAPVEVWAAERVENARAAAWGGFPAAADCGCWVRCWARRGGCWLRARWGDCKIGAQH